MSDNEAKAAVNDLLNVYATTGYLADAVANIAPDAIVTTMVGPGGDPHTFQPSTKDIQRIKSADLVVWNGLHLEARMLDILHDLGDKQVSVGQHVPKNLLLEWPEKGKDGETLYDPHIWNSPEAWKVVVNTLADSLAEKNSLRADEYRENAKRYNAKIDQTATEAQQKLNALPADRRVLLSGHDAFNYFGATNNFEVYATDFVSSDAKISPQQLSELADTIVTKKVPVIFLDNQANPQAIKSLQEAVKSRGTEVAISHDVLYADTLGAEPEVDTYLEVLAHNANVISKALSE